MTAPYRTIQLQRDTAANWTSANTLLAEGEVGLEMDTRRAKIGDGVTQWNSLLYAFSSSGGMVGSNNLSEITSASTARANLGLGNVDNTSDASKPVSTTQQAALDLKANLNSPTFTGSVTVPTPSAGTDAANMNYVDNAIAGLKWKQPVRVATTADGTLATAYRNGDTVDGVVLATGNRILLKNQTTQTENGIYTVNASGAPTRATDADTGSEILSASVFVQEGTANADLAFVCTNNTSITIGSTNIVFAQFTGGGALTPGNGITITGNSVAINTDVTADLSTAQALQNKDISNANNTYRAASLTATGAVELATTAEINTGTDTTRVMPVDQFVASNRNVRYVLYRVLDKDTNSAIGTTIGGDLEFPFTGTITEIGAFVDTAGTTGLMTIDVNKGGTTLMTTNKITLDSTEKSSRTAATAPALTTTSITAGDIITVDIDGIQTTPAKGLTIRIGVRQS